MQCLHCHGRCDLKSFAKVRITHSRTREIYDYSWEGAYIDSHGRYYFKSFAELRMAHSRTIEIYDYSWEDAYIVMDDAIWNRLQKYAWFAPGRSKSMIIADTVLTLSWTMLFEIDCKRLTHFRTIEIYDCSWDGAYMVMDAAIWDHLQAYALPTPGTSNSMITA